jgi:hypothetical protein
MVNISFNLNLSSIMTNIEKHGEQVSEEFEKWLKSKNLLLADFPTYIMIDTGTIYYHFNSEHDSAQISLNPNSLYEPRPSGLIDIYNIGFKDVDMDNEEDVKDLIKPHIKNIHEAFFKLWSINDAQKVYDLIHDDPIDSNSKKGKGFFSKLFSKKN